MADGWVVEARGLTKRFGATLALDGLDLGVAAGEVFGLVGPDGAGKTTTLRLLTGVMRPTSGTATVLGVEVTRDPEAARERLGYVPQSSSLYADLSVIENLRFHADLFGVPRRERARRAQELLGFSRLEPFADRLARNLSGGMRQKLALCVALIHRPQVLFLDEPTIGVDPVSRRDFWLLVYQLVRDGLTLVVSTPYLDEAERCHRVALMDQGHLVACDTPVNLRRLLPGTLYEVRGPAVAGVVGALRTLPGVRDVEAFGEALHVTGETGLQREAVEAAISPRAPDLAVRRIPPGLEDVFVALLKARPSAAGPRP